MPDGSSWYHRYPGKPERPARPTKTRISEWRRFYWLFLLVGGVYLTGMLLIITYLIYVGLSHRMQEWAFWVIPFSWGVWARLSYKEYIWCLKNT